MTVRPNLVLAILFVACVALGSVGFAMAAADDPLQHRLYETHLPRTNAQACPHPVIPGVIVRERPFSYPATGTLCKPEGGPVTVDFPIDHPPMCNSDCESGPFKVRGIVIACRQAAGPPSSLQRVAVSGINQGLFEAGKDAITGGWVETEGEDGVWVWESDCIYSDSNLPDYWRIRADAGSIQEIRIKYMCCDTCVEYICQ